MLQYLKQQSNKTFTENGAVTLRTTDSYCLDLFATIGAIRRESDEQINTRFMRAFAENKDVAMKLLFFARDIRGGLGERRVFKVILNWLANNYPKTVRKNLEYIHEFGRYDDFFALFDTPVEFDMLLYIKNMLYKDIENMENNLEISLLAKWLPSINATNIQTKEYAKKVARFLKLDDASYRKMIVRLRAYMHIIENNLREKDYTFDYEKQPSKALFKYRSAFMRNDSERYGLFLNKASNGETKLNASTLMPYEIIAPLLNRHLSTLEIESIDATWNSLENFTSDENSLVVIDGSGSMYSAYNPLPASVALSLGIYFAEKNKGTFKNHFITFSCNPQLVEIKGDNIFDKVKYCYQFNEVANTNIQKVFELILTTAINNSVPQEQMPKRLYIVSDMEFDHCTENASLTNFEYAKNLYNKAGYKLPEVIFWNVASRNSQQPVSKNEQGVLLVSGCTPRLFSMISDGSLSESTPYDFMMEVLMNDRYKKIVA